MTLRNEILEPLLAASPSFAPRWQQHIAHWGEEDAGIYNDLAALAHHLIEAYAAGRTTEFSAVFDSVERLLSQGSEEARAALSVGLLEDLQVIGSHHPFGGDALLRWLGPESRRSWEDIATQWEDKRSLAEVIRAEARRPKRSPDSSPGGAV